MAGFKRYLTIRRDPEALASLDGLRAIAILLVLGRHAVRPFWTPGEPLLPIGVGLDLGVPLVNGWLGVDLFFLLSGFLITRHVCRRLEEPSGFAFAPYLAGRALRILPAYLVVLFVAGFGLVPLYDPGREHLAARLGYHLLFLQDYLPANIVVVFWSLGIEAKFYLLAPPLLLALFRLRSPALRLWLVVGLIVLAPLLRLATDLSGPEVTTYPDWFKTFRSPFHLTFDGLATGVLVGLLFHLKPAWIKSAVLPGRVLAGGLVATLVLLGLAPLLDQIDPFDRRLLETVLAFSLGAILFGLVLRDRPTPCLHGRVLLVYARISYSLYLVHLPLLPATLALLDRSMALDQMTRAGQALIFIPSYILVSTLAALVLHFAVEKPFLLVKDRLQERPSKAAALPPAVRMPPWKSERSHRMKAAG